MAGDHGCLGAKRVEQSHKVTDVVLHRVRLDRN